MGVNLYKLHFLSSFFFFNQTKEFSISSLFSTQTKHNEEKLKSLLSSLPHITWGEFCPFFLNTIKKLHVPFLKNKENLLQKRDLREVFYFEKHPKTKIYWLWLILVQSLLVKLTNPLRPRKLFPYCTSQYSQYLPFWYLC